MILWFAMTVMTLAAIAAVLWPLARQRPLRAGSDVAVYRDQLDEIDRDRAAGLIGEREAEAARIEVSRRLIAAADTPAPHAAGSAAWRRQAAGLAALVLLPFGAGTLYLALGSPQLPAQTQAARRDTAPTASATTNAPPISDMVAKVEAYLEKNPDDGRAWELLGPVYIRYGRYGDAVKSLKNTVRLLGPSADRLGDLGEAMTGAANGTVTPEAKLAFEDALRQDPREARSRYFIGLAAEQAGRPKEAADIWRTLLTEAPAGADWADFVRQALHRVDPLTPLPPPTPRSAPLPQVSASPQPGPTAADIAAANEMSAEDRQTMIRGMVARLADRLKQDGSDVEGWLRLLRAYMVLGDKDQARAAAGDARRALASDPDKLHRIDELIKGLGLEG
jgi:cytochrome c-type biogenesis protein CcmH